MEITNRTSENQFVVFKLEGEYYGINIYNVKIIEKISEFTRVPNTHDFVVGVINLRGEVVPVIDLKRKFDLNESINEDESRVIIVNYNNMTVGLLVDSSSEVVNIDKNEIDKPPSVGNKVYQKFMQGIGKKDERLIILLDLEKILQKNNNNKK